MASSSEDGYSTTDRSNQISEDSFTSSDASFRHSTPAPTVTARTQSPGEISFDQYHDKEHLERLCGVQVRKTNEDLIEMTIVVIFALFAFLVFSGHF
jgi:hypothetical protein